jgi:hypothetical protein
VHSVFEVPVARVRYNDTSTAFAAVCKCSHVDARSAPPQGGPRWNSRCGCCRLLQLDRGTPCRPGRYRRRAMLSVTPLHAAHSAVPVGRQPLHLNPGCAARADLKLSRAGQMRAQSFVSGRPGVVTAGDVSHASHKSFPLAALMPRTSLQPGPSR